MKRRQVNKHYQGAYNFFFLVDSPISSSTTPTVFHFQLKPLPVSQILPIIDSLPQDCLTDSWPDILSFFLFLVSFPCFFLSFVLVPRGRLRWLLSAFGHT